MRYEERCLVCYDRFFDARAVKCYDWQSQSLRFAKHGRQPLGIAIAGDDAGSRENLCAPHPAAHVVMLRHPEKHYILEPEPRVLLEARPQRSVTKQNELRARKRGFNALPSSQKMYAALLLDHAAYEQHYLLSLLCGRMGRQFDPDGKRQQFFLGIAADQRLFTDVLGGTKKQSCPMQ